MRIRELYAPAKCGWQGRVSNSPLFGCAKEKGLAGDEFCGVGKQIAHETDDFEFLGEPIHERGNLFARFELLGSITDPRHGRIGGAGANTIDGYIMRRQFDGQRFREGDDTGL